MSSFLVLSDGDTRNRWRDGQVCPDVGQGTMAPWARRPGCVLACDAQIGRGRPRVLCDLPIRRDEGRVVNTPLVFKRVLFRERREREKRKKERREETEKKGRRRKKRGKRVGGERGARLVWRKGLSPEIGVGKTMNAGGVENRILTTPAWLAYGLNLYYFINKLLANKLCFYLYIML
ncbi:hypothetical protein TNCV_835231 [Trichonephila clavipes]|nr:hypothetical protein TNCV_835231 [Trichonephila clavipes]